MNQFDWAVAAVSVVDASDHPLYTECFFARTEVQQLAAPLVQGNLMVGRDDELHLHFLLHAALDICHERAMGRYVAGGSQSLSVGATPASADGSGAPGASAATPSSSLSRTSGAGDVRFLDRVLEEGTFAVHGFQAASGIRVLLLTVGEAPRDAVLPLCRSVYEMASVAMCAPFRVFGEPLDASRKFASSVLSTLGPFTVTARSAKTA